MSMVQLSGKTYRIVDMGAGAYDAVRLLDDVRIGSFDDGPPLRVNAVLGGELASGGESLLRKIAQIAIRSARTHWTPSRIR